MNRRSFLGNALSGAAGGLAAGGLTAGGLTAGGLTAGGLAAAGLAAPGRAEVTGALRASDVNGYLRSLAAVAEPSVDRIVFGHPDTPVSGLGTVWMPTWQACREAAAAGVNVLVVHEPAFYAHWDNEAREAEFLSAPEPARSAYLALRERKKDWLGHQGMVLIRCHDVLDRVAGFGVPHAFGRALGFADADRIRSKPYYNVYRVEEKSALEWARILAGRMKALNQPGAAFYGDPAFPVRSIGLGTGCACDPMQYMELEPDLFIAIDDTVRTWIQTVFAEDSGRPLMVVNHGTTEDPGMALLRDTLAARFPSVPCTHFAKGCGYRWVGGG